MKRSLGLAVLAALFASLAGGGARAVAPQGARFHGPDLIGAANIPYPPNTIAVGIVSLLVSLDARAQVQNVQVLRDFPSLTGVVQNAVQSWKFAAAAMSGNSVPATISVSAVFNPYNLGGTSFQSLSLDPPLFTPAPAPGGPAFIPPQITSASFATYPANSVAWGTVVLDLTIDASGQVKKVRPVRRVASLTTVAESAVQTWTFTAATLDGQPVAANIIVAFVFSRNAGQP
jgi:Gram-negative bacterial TonB protein C-terminal